MIVAAAILPHGSPAFDPGPTRDALEQVGRRLEAARPEAIVVVTPHNVHVDGHFAVVTAGKVVGAVEGRELEREVDRELAEAILAGLTLAVGVSYGSNDPAEAVMPLDWGALIPLAFLPELPVAIVSPARELSLGDHVRAGQAIGRAPGRIALVASADHGHAHDADGPYGFDPASAEYDERVVEIVRANRLEELLELEDLAARAKADSLWQMLVLHGALGEGWQAELLSYEAPTYFGMLVAAFERRPKRRLVAPRRLFDSYIAVDWSAENKPKSGKDSIWIAALQPGRPAELENPSTRNEAARIVLEQLRERVSSGERVLVGFDFPYGYPRGFADAAFPGPGPPWRRTWEGLAALVRDDERNRSNRFEVAAALNRRLGPPGPFWGGSDLWDGLLRTKRPFPHQGLKELRAVDLRLGGLQPVWKLAYPGSVGSQSLVGIPRVLMIRDEVELAGVSAVWPFEGGFARPDTPVVHAEIWPGTLAAALGAGLVRDAAQVQGVVEVWAAVDGDGAFGEWFGVPAGLAPADLEAAQLEEGWILGVN